MIVNDKIHNRINNIRKNLTNIEFMAMEVESQNEEKEIEQALYKINGEVETVLTILQFSRS